MPARTFPSQLTAIIGFSLPGSRLNHDESVYLTYDPSRLKPNEFIRVPMINLREELDKPVEKHSHPHEQLKMRGYAVFKHESQFLDGIPSEEGTANYLEESAQLLQNIVGADRVIAWNSVCRKNTTDTDLKTVTKQQAPEKGFISTTRIQPIAATAHVDQNADWGFKLCGKAAGQDASTFKRVQIINLWRPLSGPVTNAPLAMLDPTTLSPADISTHASMFGFGHDLHYAPCQQWAYIRHQMPDEAILLKCYDSDQGKSGEVLYCGHSAAQVDHDEEGVPEEMVRPRESIEVRLVAIWE
ncbi:hypothetical protein C367_06693 [Cryptococcus neoformans Ze90-1]|nr:hypothetical protein C367_06693 [Cryptococcus neoformans var. grubii Ze90-1]